MSTFAKIEFLILDVKYSISMTLRDPGMREYLNLAKTDELEKTFARENGLLLTICIFVHTLNLFEINEITYNISCFLIKII